MPVYELKCPKCNLEKEVYIRSLETEKVNSECPDCGEEMIQQFTSISFRVSSKPRSF